MLRFPALPLYTRGRTIIDGQTVLIALNCMVACFIFIYIFASSGNLASHDFVSVKYSAVPLCTLIIPYTTEYEYQKNMNDGNMRT